MNGKILRLSLQFPPRTISANRPALSIYRSSRPGTHTPPADKFTRSRELELELDQLRPHEPRQRHHAWCQLRIFRTLYTLVVVDSCHRKR